MVIDVTEMAGWSRGTCLEGLVAHSGVGSRFASIRYSERLKGSAHEQHSNRFGVVVQSDVFLPRTVVLIAPTSMSARAASFRPEIHIDGTTAGVLVEQTGAVDATRLGDLVGHLNPEEQWGVDESLLAVLALR